jgi:hypothetical protein
VLSVPSVSQGINIVTIFMMFRGQGGHEQDFPTANMLFFFSSKSFVTFVFLRDFVLKFGCGQKAALGGVFEMLR